MNYSSTFFSEMGSGTSSNSRPNTVKRLYKDEQYCDFHKDDCRRKSTFVPKSLVHKNEALLNEEEVKNILLGNPSYEVQSNFKVVRIFTSSTFTDTFEERNALMEKVYPKLKSFCQEQGYDFQVVDMRWGVREMAENEHTNTELCLKEIHACQKLSTGPTFVSFLSHKYGYRPFPREIRADHFDQITADISDEQKPLIQRWFRKDTNSQPAAYVLQPISTHFPEYISSDSQLHKKAKNDFWEVYLQLQDIIFRGAKKNLRPEEAKHYIISVTEREIIDGILKDSDASKHCLWFKRNIEDIDKQAINKKLSRFCECLGDKDKITEAQNLLSKIREDVLPKAMASDNVIQYNIKWTEKGVDPTDPDHSAYLTSLCVDFETRMKELINLGISEGPSQEVQRHPVYNEIIHHVQFCNHKCSQFCGRDDLLEKMESYMRSKNSLPCIIYGESGCGKTSLLAVTANQAYTWMDKKAAIVYRFIGTSPGSSSVRLLLHSLNQQLGLIYSPNVSFQHKSSNDLQVLVQSFHSLLGCVTKDRPLVLLLDGIDQIDVADGGRQLQWLPKQLPTHVKLILSTLPDEKFGCLNRCKAIFPQESCYIEAKSLGITDIESILKKWLSSIKRSLTGRQHELLLATLKACPSPLFLKLSFDEARRWHSYDLPDHTELKTAVLPAICNLFEKIEKLHGQILVVHALGFLTAAKFGLSEGEMEDCLSLSDMALNDVYQYWKPPIRRLPPLLWVRIKYELEEYLIKRSVDKVQVIYWYHRQFIEVAKSRYLGDASTEQYINTTLADYFTGIWSEKSKPFFDTNGAEKSEMRFVAKQPLMYETGKYNFRKLNQLPHHLIQAKDLEGLKREIICNYNFLLAKISAVGIGQLLADLKEAQRMFPRDQDISIIQETLQLSHDVLNTHPLELAGQLCGRLQVNNSSNASTMDEARRAIENNQLEADAAVMAGTLLDMMDSCMATQSDKYTNLLNLLSQLKQADSPVLVPHTSCLMPPGGQLLHKISEHWEKVNDIDIAPDGMTFVSCSDDNTVKLWDTVYADMLGSVTLPTDVTFVSYSQDGKHVIASTLSNLYIIDTSMVAVTKEIESPCDEQTMVKPAVICSTQDKKTAVIILTPNRLDIVDAASGDSMTCMSDGLDQNTSQKFNDKKLIAAHKHYVIYTSYMANFFYILPLKSLKSFELLKVKVFPEAVKFNDICSGSNPAVPFISAICVAQGLKKRDLIVACDGYTQSFHFYDLLTQQRVLSTPGKLGEEVTQCFFSPINQYLYYTTRDKVGIINLDEGERKTHFSHPCPVSKVVSSNGMHVITQGEDNVLRVWDQRMAPFTPDMSAFTGKVAVKSERTRNMALQMLNVFAANFDMEDSQSLSAMITSSELKNYWSKDYSTMVTEKKFITKFHPFPKHSRYLVVSQSSKMHDSDTLWTHCITIWDLKSNQCMRRSFLPMEALYFHFMSSDGLLILAKLDEFRSTEILSANHTDFKLTLLPDEPWKPEKNRELKHFANKNVFVAQSGTQRLTVYDEHSGRSQWTVEVPDTLLEKAMSLPKMRMEHLAFTNIHMLDDNTIISVWALKYLCIWHEKATQPGVTYDLHSHFLTFRLHDDNVAVAVTADECFLLVTVNGKMQGEIKSAHSNRVSHSVQVFLHDFQSNQGQLVSAMPQQADQIEGNHRLLRHLYYRGNECFLILLAVTSDAQVYLLDEVSLSTGVNHITTTPDARFLVTWRGCHIVYWEERDMKYQNLGAFTMDEQVDDVILANDGHHIIVNSLIGIVQLRLAGKSLIQTDPEYASQEALFTDQLLNIEV